jgi:phosphoesterase RecJ-like protein
MTEKEMAAFLHGRDNFLILTHVRPDGDTIGCAGALVRALRNIGKTAYAAPNGELTKMCSPYIDDCFAPSDFVPDTVVSVDIAALSLLPENMTVYRDRVDAAIDHHPSYEGFGKRSCVRPDRAACGEILFDIISGFTEITSDVATPLYAAVATDTGCFMYTNTSPNTHIVAAELMRRGADYKTVNKVHFRTKSRVRIKLEAEIMSHMEFYDGGRIAVVIVPRALLDRLNATEDDADEISSLAGVTEGVDCAITIRELRGGESKVSLRTGPRVNATEVCRLLGGGGHAAAAGATLSCPVGEAKRVMLDTVASVVPDCKI